MAAKANSSRLTRSETDRIIAGVCGGLAEYFAVDATLIRIIFVLLTVFGGSGLIIYLILWLLFPVKSSSAKTSEEYIKANVEELKTKSRKLARNGDGKVLLGIILIIFGASLLLENLGVFVFRFVWKLWPLILVAIGISILAKKK